MTNFVKILDTAELQPGAVAGVRAAQPVTQRRKGPVMPVHVCGRMGLLLWLGLLLAACGGRQAAPAPTATPIVIARNTPTPLPSPTPVASLLQADLLALGSPACEETQTATLRCEKLAGGGQQLAVEVGAATFARWHLRLPAYSQPLGGDEILQLRLRRTGNLTPNLYFVAQDGQRFPVNLARLGLGEEWRTLHIPLREVQGQDAARPDFSRLEALQIVFEWADMAGTLDLADVRFVPVWQEEVALPSLPPGVTVPDGFVIEPVAGVLRNPTQLEVVDESRLLVSEQAGRVWLYTDDNGDGRFESRRLFDSGYAELVGLLADPVDGSVWLGGRGQLWRAQDTDGDGAADARSLRLDGLAWGRHQNNGLTWNPVADPFSGEPAFSWLYFGLGSTEDLEDGGELNSTVLRFPRDGQGREDLEVVSRGNRNAYDVLWAPVQTRDDPDAEPVWALFASENGPDFNDAPDEVNHIRWGHHYGFPQQFGPVAPPAEEGLPYSGPVYAVAAHASADGLAYVTNPAWPTAYRTLYVALFGEVFSEERVGHTVDRIRLERVESATGPTFRGEADVFVDGLDRPLALTSDPAGNLLIADYASGIVYRVRFVGGG